MLREMQTAFRDGVFGPDATAACGFIAPGAIPPDRRFAIYRSNTLISLTDTLIGAFPAVYRVLGDHVFRIAAARYIRRQPPRVPQLLSYGDAFPAFLDTFAPARDHGFVADLARLEWARQAALFAPDAEPLTPAALQAVPADAYPGLRFILHPSVRIVDSVFPVQRIWETARMADGAVTDGAVTDGGVPASKEAAAGDGETVLVNRPQLAVAMRRLGAGDAALVSAIRAGATLAAAAEAAADAAPGFDLQQALLGHLNQCSFAAFRFDGGQQGNPI